MLIQEDNHQSFWAEEEGLSTAEGDNSQSSYRTEGEEFDPSEIPTNIPPEIAPEVSPMTLHEQAQLCFYMEKGYLKR